jgi:hypothetical protein
MSLAWILRGFLEWIRMLCYNFIQSRDQGNKVIVSASWKKISLPKENGVWGLKNPFMFSKALATKIYGY